jgi:hypothetical protein
MEMDDIQLTAFRRAERGDHRRLERARRPSNLNSRLLEGVVPVARENDAARSTRDQPKQRSRPRFELEDDVRDDLLKPLAAKRANHLRTNRFELGPLLDSRASFVCLRSDLKCEHVGDRHAGVYRDAGARKRH